MDYYESIRKVLKNTFPSFSDCRFPVTYHHDYAARFDPRYFGLSRSEMWEVEELSDPLDIEYERYLYSVLYLISSYPDEFQQALPIGEILELLAALQTKANFQQNWIP